MKIQFYVPDTFSKYYLPFLLYRESLIHIIKNNYPHINIQCINNIKLFTNDENTILIMNINSISKDILKNLQLNQCKKVLINTENVHNMNVLDIIKFIDDKESYYVLDYNVLNIEYYKNNTNIKFYFIPLCYNDYLSSYYQNQIITKTFDNKDIDILFFGSMNTRRSKILDVLKTRYNVVIYSGKSGENENKEICNLIERSKFVLNILFYNDNSIFDYYRNSLILVSNSLLINEKYKNKDYDLEYGLLELENNIINVDYDIIDSLDNYMKMDVNTYNDMLIKQKESFKKYNMDDKVLRFFNQFI